MEEKHKVVVELEQVFRPINEAEAAKNWGEWSNDMKEILNQSGSSAL